MTPTSPGTRERIGRGVALPCLVLAAGLAAPADAAHLQRYELEVGLDTEHRRVSVSGRVSLLLDEDESTLSFGLHETFRIAECAIDGLPIRCARVEADASGAAPREVSVQLPEGAGPGPVDLTVRYDGTIENRPGWGEPDARGPFMDDSAGPDRIELALYSSWYPSFGFGPTFDAELTLTMPRGWAVTCIGRQVNRRETDTRTTTRWAARAVNDLVIVASPRLRSKDTVTAAGIVRIHHTRLPDPFLARKAQEAEQTLLLFSKLLGETSAGRTLQHVYSPREWGQGFARPGMIVVSEGRVLRTLAENPDASFLYGDAHEAAHLWWRFGSGQGDWINETFAEYFALVALQSLQGEGSYQDGLAQRRESVAALPADAPALAAVLGNDGHGYTVKYDKGALMLHAFRQHLGDDAFFRACRHFYASIRDSGAETDDFRTHWKGVLKDDDLLPSWLDSRGSGPVSSPD